MTDQFRTVDAMTVVKVMELVDDIELGEDQYPDISIYKDREGNCFVELQVFDDGVPDGIVFSYRTRVPKLSSSAVFDPQEAANVAASAIIENVVDAIDGYYETKADEEE